MKPPHNKNKIGYLFKKLPKYGLNFIMWEKKIDFKKRNEQAQYHNSGIKKI